MLKSTKQSELPFQKNPLLILFLLIGWLFVLPLAASNSPSLSENKKIKIKLGRLPLLFEKNEGQVDASVLYLTRSTSNTFYFRPHDILLLLKKEMEEQECAFFPLKMEFAGSSFFLPSQGGGRTRMQKQLFYWK